MRKILLVLPSLLVVMIASVVESCRFAPSANDGDTVAASVFEPADTSVAVRGKIADSLAGKRIRVADSVGIYYVGTGSTKQFLQLVSYPSRRDTLVYGKTRHVKVKGSADYNNVVRVKFYLLNGKDSLVSAVEQVVME